MHCESDWTVDSWKMTLGLHPDWAEQAFAMLNIGDMFNPAGEVNCWLSCPYELFDYVGALLDPVFAGHPQFNVTLTCPSDTGSDQFCHSQSGVTVIDATMGEPDECLYRRDLYHTNRGNKGMGTSSEAYRMEREVFAKLLVGLDVLAVCARCGSPPRDFTPGAGTAAASFPANRPRQTSPRSMRRWQP